VEVNFAPWIEADWIIDSFDLKFSSRLQNVNRKLLILLSWYTAVVNLVAKAYPFTFKDEDLHLSNEPLLSGLSIAS